MSSEKLKDKPRICDKCGKTLTTTAKGLKAHARAC